MIHKYKNTLITLLLTIILAPSVYAYTGISPLDGALTLLGNLFSVNALQNPTVALGIAKLAWFVLLFAILAYAARRVFKGDNAALDKKTAHIVAFVIAAISTFFTPMNVLMTATTGYAAFIWSLIIIGPAILALYLAFGTKAAKDKDVTSGQRLIEFVILGAGFLWTSFMLGTLLEWMRDQFPQVSGIVEASAGYMALIMVIALIVKLFQLLGAGNWDFSKVTDLTKKTPKATKESTKEDTKNQPSAEQPTNTTQEQPSIDFSIKINSVTPTPVESANQQMSGVKTDFTITGPQAPYGIKVFHFKRGEENELQKLVTTNKTDRNHDWFAGENYFSARTGTNSLTLKINYENLKDKYFVIAAFISGQVRYDAVFVDAQGNMHRENLPEQAPSTQQTPQDSQRIRPVTEEEPRRRIRPITDEDERPSASQRLLQNKVAFYLSSNDAQEVRVKLTVKDARGNILDTKEESQIANASFNVYTGRTLPSEGVQTRRFIYPIRPGAQIYVLELLSHEFVNGQATKILLDGSRQENQLANGLVVNVEGAQQVTVNAQIRYRPQQENPARQETPQEPSSTPQESSRTLRGPEKGGVSNRINNLVTKINELRNDLNEEPDVPGHWLNKHQIACIDKLSELLRKLRETEQGRKAIQELETNFSNSREETAKQYVIKLLIRDKNEFSSNIKKRSNQYQTIFRGYERRTKRPIDHKEIAMILQEIAQFLEQKKQEFMDVNN